MKFVCGILTVTGYRDYTCCYMGPQPFFFVGIKTYCDQQIRPQNSCTAFVNNPDETPVDAGIDCRRTGTSGYFSPNGRFAFVCDQRRCYPIDCAVRVRKLYARAKPLGRCCSINCAVRVRKLYARAKTAMLSLSILERIRVWFEEIYYSRRELLHCHVSFPALIINVLGVSESNRREGPHVDRTGCVRRLA